MFLALPAEAATLTSVTFYRYRWTLIPRELIVDVHHAEYMDPIAAPFPLWAKTECRGWINRDFDRLEAASYRLGDNDNTSSMHRRILRYTPDGRAILQDTNVSYFDFVVARYSPGTVEY